MMKLGAGKVDAATALPVGTGDRGPGTGAKWVVLLALLALSPAVFAQQITRFAVVDMARVYSSFFQESRAVREFEEKSRRVQQEIDRMMAEIQTLREQQADAEAQGDADRALRLENEVYTKSETLKNYYATKTAQLENERTKLAQSQDFVEQVRAEVQHIAETEGYSLVLNLNEARGVVWYSQSVDITRKVIENLRSKAGR